MVSGSEAAKRAKRMGLAVPAYGTGSKGAYAGAGDRFLFWLRRQGASPKMVEGVWEASRMCGN